MPPPLLCVADLRTGVTAEQSKNGMTLNLCLQEIDRCGPYFLCLLGERYGWSQPDDTYPDELLKKTFNSTIENFPQYSWIDKYRDRSVTEIEIRQAVLNNASKSSPSGHGVFFFRSSEYPLQMIAEGKLLSTDLLSYQAENSVCAMKLSSLKEEICRSGYPVKMYHHHEELRDTVIMYLKEKIRADFPDNEGPTDMLGLETSEHTSFAESRVRTYVGQSSYFEFLDNYLFSVVSDDQHSCSCLVTGTSGCGKSSLLANWMKRASVTYARNIFYMHSHFIGCSNHSADGCVMLLRLVEELKVRFFSENSEIVLRCETLPSRTHDYNATLPSDWESLVLLLPIVLDDVSAVLRHVNAKDNGCSDHAVVLLIILDAVNQLADGHQTAFQFSWLPRALPPFIGIVVSSTPLVELEHDDHSPAWSAIAVVTTDTASTPLVTSTSNGATAGTDFKFVLTLKPLDESGVRGIAEQYMKDFGKTLAENQLRMLVASEQTRNPLFLKAVLDEVRQWYENYILHRVDVCTPVGVGAFEYSSVNCVGPIYFFNILGENMNC